MSVSIGSEYKLNSQKTKIDPIRFLFIIDPTADTQLNIANMNALTQSKTLRDIAMCAEQVFQEMNYQLSCSQLVSQFDHVFVITLNVNRILCFWILLILFKSFRASRGKASSYDDMKIHLVKKLRQSKLRVHKKVSYIHYNMQTKIELQNRRYIRNQNQGK